MSNYGGKTMRFNMRKQKQLLAECVISKAKDPRVKMILEADNDDYFLRRAIEDTSCALDTGSSMTRQALLKRAIILLNIVRYRYEEQKEKETSDNECKATKGA